MTYTPDRPRAVIFLCATFLALTTTSNLPCSAFPSPLPTSRTGRTSASSKPFTPRAKGEKDPNNIFDTFFTGGAFDGSDVEDEAVKIASKIRTVKDLGWSGTERRRGSARPRHRAFGGSGEKPVQLKPNYDETKSNCVEKWLTQEDFYSLVKNNGPAADTVFVALAGGGAFAEREVCETKLEQWRRSGGKLNASFDESAFLKSVKQGRTELSLGWALFLSLNGFFASSIVFPTNPAAKALEHAIERVQGAVL